MYRSLFVKNSDIVLAIFVVFIAAMLLVPLPASLLDIFITLNISFSFLLLLVGLYIPNALALLAFPSLLLLTTLFRLSLNVASTRLILTDGYAGEVIQAFGDFLIAGDAIVGAVIFTIITIVNFIVITRGASRVSEVSARFALDALPGKQMAIDADLRAGTISAEEAGKKREKLRMESQLYGAMDGAMKFVQGDAIAGLFITATNILGGLYIGMFRGQMSFAEAISSYTILTVGDGLVSQIPSLLISICAGIIVTRVSSGENRTLGHDLAAQLFQSPLIVGIAGIIALVIGLLPDLPFLPFSITAFLLFGVTYLLNKRLQGRREQIIRRERITYQNNRHIEEDEESRGDAVEIYFDHHNLYQTYQQDSFRIWCEKLKHDFYNATGLHLPSFEIKSSDNLPNMHYKAYLRGIPLVSGAIPEDAFLLEINPQIAVAFGFEVIKKEKHPISGNEIAWCNNNQIANKLVDAFQIKAWLAEQFVAFKVARCLQLMPEELLSIVDTHSVIKDLQQKYPGLISEAFNTEFINISRMTSILQKLAIEGVNIKNFKQILESVASYCSMYGASMVQEDDFDVQDIVSFIRHNRNRQLLSGFLSFRGALKTIILSKNVIETFSNCRLVTDLQSKTELVRGIYSMLDAISIRGLGPVAIVSPVEIREKIRSFIQEKCNFVGVFSYDELDVAQKVEIIGMW